MATKIKKNEELQVIDYRYDEGFRGRVEHDIVSTLTTKASGYSGLPMIMKSNGGGQMLRIRKLTPKECMRLMGFTDEDYQALKDIGLSDSAIYHCAGDSLVVSVMASMLYPFVYDKEQGHIQLVEDYIEKNIIEDRKSTDTMI